MKQRASIDELRMFIERVEWVTVTVAAYFLYGEATTESKRNANTICTSLYHTKKKEKRLLRLQNEHAVVYATPRTRKKRKGSIYFVRDEKLRIVLAIMAGAKPEYIKEIGMGDKGYAYLGNHCFELILYRVDPVKLRQIILANYVSNDPVQAVFITATGSRKIDSGFEYLEQEKMQEILDFARTVLPNKPNKVVCAPFSEYVATGKLYTFKGEC